MQRKNSDIKAQVTPKYLENDNAAVNHPVTNDGPNTVPQSPKIITVCLSEEPTSLYILAQEGRGWGHIQEALRDGPIEQRMYSYQPVILDKLPHWEDGDVWITETTVNPGEMMVAADGRLITLEPGVPYWTPKFERSVAQDAERITTIEMHVVFKLRSDVLWSDGKALTAADSVFGFQIASDADTPTSKVLALRTQSYEAVGPLTIEWTGAAGYFNHDYVMSFAEPLPLHRYGHLSAAEMLTDVQVNRYPVGWGAFRVTDWIDGEYISLERNENYFRRSENLPHIDELHFVFTKTEVEALTRLTDGTCHIALRNQWDAWEKHVEDLLSDQSAQKLALQFIPGPILEHIDFGINSNARYRSMADNNILKSVEIRQAFAHCIDRKKLADAVQWGTGVLAHSYVPANHPLYNDEEGLYRYDYDPEHGRALLSGTGWETQDDSAVRSQDGSEFVLKYSTNIPHDYSGRLRKIIADLVKADLGKCGIELIVIPYAAEDMYSEWPHGVVFGRKFDLAEYAWILPSDPRCELYRTDQIPDNDYVGGINATGYSNPAFDAACDQATLAQDRAHAAEGHKLAQFIFARDLPSIPLFFRLRIAVARPELIGLQIDPTHPSHLWNVEAFDIVHDP